VELINKWLSGCIVPVAVVASALFFLFILKGKPIFAPWAIIKSLCKRERADGVSPLRAVILALAGTLGVGNIVGVSSAIALGGPGAVFWMWISAILAMILKYGEVVLALLHRRKRGAEYFGGAMYYIKDHFNSCQKKKLGSIFSLIFTLFCLINGITMGCMIQSSSISSSFESTFGINKAFSGIVLVAASVSVFFFKGKRVFTLCEKAVPLASTIYIFMSLFVIVRGWDQIPCVLSFIIEDAFSFEGAIGGIIGFLTSRAIRFGTIRGLFSNEAGCGTSPIAHATSSTDSPCRQGMLGIVEVFIDTIVVCSMTSFVILLGNGSSDDPMLTVLYSFQNTIGDGAGVLLSLCVLLFAFATIVCWGYYGKECVYYLNKSRAAEKIYYAMYTVFVFIGAIASMDRVWELADLAIGIMTVMNLFILLSMRREIKQETERYFNKKRTSDRKS